MFLALDAYWDDSRDRVIGAFLSDANPYLVKGRGSADPAVWQEFSSAFHERFHDDWADLVGAHKFIQEYLDGISNVYAQIYPGGKRLNDAFVEIAPLELWKKAFESE